MENIVEMLYGLSQEKIHTPDTHSAGMGRIRNENMELLMASMTNEQKDLMDAYFAANSSIVDKMELERFRFAFHLGALLMAELIEGRKELLRG